VVMVPETFIPSWVMRQLTNVVPSPVAAATVFGFESSPFPENVGGDSSVFVVAASGGPEPAPQPTPDAAKAAAVMIARTGLMTPPQPPVAVDHTVNSGPTPFIPIS